MKKIVSQFTKLMIAVTLFMGAFLTLQADGANLLPNGKQIFFNNDGSPCAGCSVYFYIPSTTTPKDTYQDSGQTILNSNPVVLDSAGTAVIYGTGQYRQIFKDSLGNTIWDKLTSDATATGSVEFAGTSTGSANAQAISASNFTGSNGQAIAFYAGFTNTNAMTLAVSGGSPIVVRKDTTGGSVTLNGGEVAAGNLVVVFYDSTNGYFHLVNNANYAQLNSANTFSGANTFSATQTFSVPPILSQGLYNSNGIFIQPCGRLTITSGTPIITTDTTGQTTVFYTPQDCNSVPLWDGAKWQILQFSEVSQTLADSTKSPAAALVNSVYDMFGWLDNGTFRVTRGPPWTSSVTRGTGAGTTELTRVNGIWMNAQAITNGPAASRGIYLGTIATDGNGANGQLNMVIQPTPAAGGTNNRLDVWNMYNRVLIPAICRDSTNTWTYSSSTIRSSNNSDSNRISFVIGINEDSVEARFYQIFNSLLADPVQGGGIGYDSNTAISSMGGEASGYMSANARTTGIYEYTGFPSAGRHFLQELEWSTAGLTTYIGDDNQPSKLQSALILKVRM